MGHILMDFLSSGSDASPGKSLWLMCMHDALSPAAHILHISEPSLNLWFHSAKTQNLLSSTPATSQGSRNYNYWTVQSVMSCKFPVRVTVRRFSFRICFMIKQCPICRFHNICKLYSWSWQQLPPTQVIFDV